MNEAEYANLERVEREHWYYAGKRELVSWWIEACRPPGPDDTLLDFGAGTGLFAERYRERCRVKVLDAYEESRRLLERRFAPSAILTPDGVGIPLPSGSVQCLTALDVLEHIGPDAEAVREFHRVLAPDGLIVATVPADMRLWSDWDVALRHFRRYDRRSLAVIFPTSDWEIVRLGHTNTLAYPAVLLIRTWRKWRGVSSEDPVTRSEDRVPPAWLNRLLRALFVQTAIRRWFPAPFGVSLLIVARPAQRASGAGASRRR